ncbi:MAG TPA: phosphatase PAP2 family protein [Solirubrobacteraceae bacterium]|jgi:membrane-associated phospholipid phosphatase|nr:phosphatase PAP2 family protein [Solirubrobacteraceae bacterium]
MASNSRAAAGLALTCLLGLLITGLYFLKTAAGHHLDAEILASLVSMNTSDARPWLQGLIRVTDPPFFLVVGAALAATAAGRGQWRVVAAIGVLLVAGTASAEVIKAVIGPTHSPDILDGREALWPSAHAVAAVTLALSAVIVTRGAARLLVGVLGVVFATAVGYALLITGAHRPSDLFAAVLLSGLWLGATTVGLAYWQRRSRATRVSRSGGLLGRPAA